MKKLILQRISYFSVGPHRGTSGVLVDSTGLVPFCVTLELPWRSNKPNVSCIPAQEYLCKKTDSPRFGETYEVTDVFQRTHILFHKGNLDDHTKGCILLGESYGLLIGEPAVLHSGNAFTEFKNDVLNNADEFILEIKPPCVTQHIF